MDSPTPSPVVPIFATPFAVLELPEAQKHNAVVAASLAARTDAARLCYRGPDDLLEGEDEAVRKIGAELVRGLWRVVAAVSEFNEEVLRTLSVQARLAFTIIQPDGSVPAQSYPLSSWCGIYCVEAPPPSPSRQDSGVLRLYESRFTTMFSDSSNQRLRIPFTPGHYSWRPEPGQVAFFPASLTHEIAMVRSAGRLILLTLRARFLGPGQEPLSRW